MVGLTTLCVNLEAWLLSGVATLRTRLLAALRTSLRAASELVYPSEDTLRRSLDASKAGEEIVDQLYHFTLHDRELALRAEMTPSIARMVIARQGAMRFPIRWFTVTQNWRYERMTRGRRREHYQ